MSKRTDAAHTLGVAAGRREACERLAQFIRQQLELWKQAEAPKQGGPLSKLRAQFLSSVNAAWLRRGQSILTAVETDLVRLRAEEEQARQDFEATGGLGRWL